VRPWSPIPIQESGEALLELPPQLLRLEPHPYAALGAPYGATASPFRLRQGVIERLLAAQESLAASERGWRLAIFDAWRPLAVQQFMVQQAIIEECSARGVDRHKPSAQLEAVISEVGRFWAPPSDDPATPPPHSTGAAVDLTLVDSQGAAVAMGSAIDAIGDVSEPDHHRQRAMQLAPGPERNEALAFQRHRDLLRDVMEAAGFAQHPNEWWHFSWGDQLWAWRSGVTQAHYGRWLDP
jgi:D-alanyl-D-alanine dipeptidase